MTVRYVTPTALVRNGITTAFKATSRGLASTDTLVCKFDDDSRIAFLLSSYSTSAVTDITFRVTVKPGEDGLAYKNALGAQSFTFETTAAITPDGKVEKHAFLGPFESAQFAIAATSATDGITPKGVNTLVLDPIFITRATNITTASNDKAANKLAATDGGRVIVTAFKLPK